MEVDDTAFAADFPSDEFRSAILNTMTMGTPNKESMRATFMWKPEKTYANQDPAKKPYKLTPPVTPTKDTTPDPVQALVAVETIQRAPDGTPLGKFDTPRAVLTMLDVEYEKVKGANVVLLGEDRYAINQVFNEALFNVDVFTLQCEALEES